MIQQLINKYHTPTSTDEVAKRVDEIKQKAKQQNNIDNLKKIFGLIDLTTLSSTDTRDKVKTMCTKVNDFHSFTRFVGIPKVAAVCVYPALVETARQNLTARNVKLASVSGGFPSSQTFPEIKVAETKLAIAKGADEIDVVISLGRFLENDWNYVFNELKELKKVCGKKHLKVILESGILQSPEKIKIASIIAIEAGADFIKTSTGKMEIGATLEAAWVMTQTIHEYFQKTKKRIGFKPAGGISTPAQALEYFTLVNTQLGAEWITPEFFRIGASCLANALLNEIQILKNAKDTVISYF